MMKIMFLFWSFANLGYPLLNVDEAETIFLEIMTHSLNIEK
ncbi:MAG TPA: hypothetical protein VEY70_01560 [Metabacillus sp.]|nr:hypothetical protein [Metabacillus sp.]